MGKAKGIDRRSFLKISTVATGGLLVSVAVPAVFKSVTPGLTAPAIIRLNPFLKIGTDNSITILLSKVEMGQGIWTTLPMLIAEELDCDLKKIIVEHCPSGQGDDFKQHIFVLGTGGSDSTKSSFETYRQAGATARMMLITAAAKKLNLPPDKCSTDCGYILGDGKRIPYGEVANDASRLPVPTLQLDKTKSWKYIGKSQARLDLPDKICGRAVYGCDIHFDGLLTAVVAHSPVIGGTVISFDASKAVAIQGVQQVVQVPTGIAVIADNFWSAKKGRDALIIKWDPGPGISLDSNAQLEEYHRLSKTKGVITQQKGDVESGLLKSVKLIERSFSFPYLAHAPMETLNCTVKIEPGKCEVWSGTQSPLLHQLEVAKFMGLKNEQVVFHTPMIGGSFGRRGSMSKDWVLEALTIAKASNKPIKLMWTREDDIQGANYRPMYVHRALIAIGADGFPIAWKHTIVGQSIFKNTELEKEIVSNGIDYSSIDGVQGSPYLKTVPDHALELITTEIKIPILAWRSVGNTHTAFVMESLIDELAKEAGKDPVEYRRSLLKNSPRHLASLNLAAEKAGWNKPLPKGLFRGVAVHAAMGSFVTQIVELTVENKSIKIHRVVCAIDCGLAVNPDGVVAQMESGIIFGMTAALYGEITIEKGEARQSNFHDYRLLRMNESPKIEVYLVDSNEPMGGAGEPGVPPIAPAIANAIFEATGIRMRDLPLRLQD